MIPGDSFLLMIDLFDEFCPNLNFIVVNSVFSVSDVGEEIIAVKDDGEEPNLGSRM